MDDTVQLMVLAGSDIQFIDGIESSAALRVAARIGGYMPAYCSAGGKAILAALPWAEVERRHPTGLAPWGSAKVQSLSELQNELVHTRSARYGFNSDETEVGVTGVGVSIQGSAGSAVAAFTVAVPTARFRQPDLSHYVRALTTAAQSASRTLRRALPHADRP
nr:IclR family transcriptional regulator C-terminal domain-containing protein [Microbacterium protaetiae]